MVCNYRIDDIDSLNKVKLTSLKTNTTLVKRVDFELLIPHTPSNGNSVLKSSNLDEVPTFLKTVRGGEKLRKKDKIHTIERAKIYNQFLWHFVAHANKWLADEHIELAQGLLARQHPSIGGFQPLYIFQSKNCERIGKPNGRFVQLMHVGGNHWITVSNVEGDKPTQVYIYDSLYNDIPFESKNKVLKQIALMLMTKTAHFSLYWADVQQQIDGSSCGLFAIANATALCESKCPSMYIWILDKMRNHIAACFKSENVTIFPFTSESRDNRKVTREEMVNVCFNCSMPIYKKESLIDYKHCMKEIHGNGCCEVADMCEHCKIGNILYKPLNDL